MDENRIEVKRLIAQIREAFGSAVYPGDNNIFAFETDLEGFTDDFKGFSWQDVPALNVFRNWAYLSWFSPSAFRYYLPAFLVESLNPDSELANMIGEGIKSTLTTAQNCSDSPEIDAIKSKVAGLTPKQLIAIRDYFEFLHGGVDGVDDEIHRSLRHIWRPLTEAFQDNG